MRWSSPIVALALAVAGCAKSATVAPPLAPPIVEPAITTELPPGWSDYTLDGVIVSLPLAPERTEAAIAGPDGPIAVIQHSVEIDRGTLMLALTTMPYDITDPDQRLINGRDASVSNPGAILISDEPFTFDGAKGRAFRFEDDSPSGDRVIGSYRMMFKGRVIYQMFYLRTVDNVAFDEMGELFLTSFRFAK